MNLQKINSWQTALTNAVTDPKELLELLELEMSLLDAARAAARDFPLKVPRGFIARMQKGDPNDPLLRQILPIGAELEKVAGYSKDPLEEAKANPIPGLLHKYHGRVLLTLVGACAVNCRYCFRRHFPYADNNPGSKGWDQALDYIAQNKTITEVILSGGDPLLANDNVLLEFTNKLAEIPHIKRLRIHSRIPIVLPERITDEFIAWLKSIKQKIILVVHCNHAQEIDESVEIAMRNLTNANIVLLNQSVLLKNINNTAEALINLSERLFESGIQPYYLHILDKVQGAAHFDLDIHLAKKLQLEITKKLPGYLVPKFVYEQAGAPSKLLISGDHIADHSQAF